MHRFFNYYLALALVAAICVNACPGGIPQSEVDSFLKIHNAMRTKISKGQYTAKGRRMPAAKTPIPMMTWNCAMEAEAQQWAKRCVFGHSSNRKDEGENIFMSMNQKGQPVKGMAKKASDSWEKEFQDKGWPSVKMTNQLMNLGVGHATQMAWAQSTQLGCGIAQCKNKKEAHVVCRYKHAGNMFGKNIYDPK